MSQVIIAGDTSGTITLQAPAVSGSSVLTLPATTATLATLTTPSFGTTIGVGGATASASGSGISFPATQSASSDANTLDDYEEGTWTGTLTSATPPTTPPTATGTYTKIGRQVTITINFDNVNTSGGSGLMRVSGIPFSAVNSPCYVGSVQFYGMNFNAYVTCYTNSAGIYFESMTSGAAWTDLAITAGTTKYIQCSVTYFTT
jgi:hypothetical protein